MSNDRDDIEGQDDSEYHFSDEEVTYEVESELPKTTPASSDQGGGASRVANSKRMFISFGVFLAIVFVVYKFVSGGSSAPPTDISAAPAAQPAVAEQTKAPSPVQAQPVPVAPAVVAVTPPTVNQQPAQPVLQPPAAQQPVQPPMQPNPPAVASMPAVIPVQSAVPAGQSPAAAMTAYIEDKTATLSTSSQQAMNQMQSQTAQQYNEFAAQNKSMQNQIQSLSTRVADLEAQINQLVQVLTRRAHNSAPSPVGGSSMNGPGAPPVQQPSRGPDVRVAYNVQAIIPGRAWLKSDNGETLTVAEGDVIRDVGRVTKIDPYDGVVEINTGTRAVSLSYGNGG